jgi:membrane protease YdiL (CAAX protease family)
LKRDAAALAFAMSFPAAMAYVYFVALAAPGRGANPGLVVAYGAAKAVQFAFPLVYVWVWDRSRLRPAWPGTGGLALGAGFGLVVGAVILALYGTLLRHSPLTATAPEKIHLKVQEFDCDTPARFAGLAVFIAVVHSFGEEYYWRWFVFGRLRRYLSLAAAVGLSSVAFMAHHVIVLSVYFPGRFWTAAVPLSLGVAVGGAVWALLYERTRSLVAVWLSHVLIDLAIMAVGYQMLTPYWTGEQSAAGSRPCYSRAFFASAGTVTCAVPRSSRVTVSSEVPFTSALPSRPWRRRRSVYLWTTPSAPTQTRASPPRATARKAGVASCRAPAASSSPV